MGFDSLLILQLLHVPARQLEKPQVCDRFLPVKKKPVTFNCFAIPLTDFSDQGKLYNLNTIRFQSILITEIQVFF